MKYTYETTEGETKLILEFIGSVTGQILNALQDLRPHNAPPPVASDDAPGEGAPEKESGSSLKDRIQYGEVEYGSKRKASNNAASLHSDTPAANPYADMDFSNYTDMPDEYKNIKPPIWIPDTNGHGFAEFDKLVHEWSVNLGVEGADQPDRPTLMRECANHPKVLAMLGHVAETGGLAHAVALYVNDTAKLADFTAEEKARVNLIATTMCQVSSILFPDLAQMYEHRDIFKERK